MERVTEQHLKMNENLTGLIGIAYDDTLRKDNYNKLIDYLFGAVINPDEAVRRHVRANPALIDSRKYVFEAYRVVPYRLPRDPNDETKGYYLAGLRFLSEKPVKRTCTEWRYVKDCFAQLEPNFFQGSKSMGDQAASTLIYLPMKPKPVVKEEIEDGEDGAEPKKRGRKPNDSKE